MADHVDAVITDGLRERSARGVPRGHDEVLRAARAADGRDLPGRRTADDSSPAPRRSRTGLQVAAAVLIFLVAAAVVYRRAGAPPDDLVMPGATAPMDETTATSATAPASVEGCPIATECLLPPHPTAIDVPGLPPGWTRTNDPQRGMFPDSPRALLRDYAAPRPEIHGPGGPVPQRIHLVLYIDPGVAVGDRTQWSSKPAVPLGHGRTLYVLTSQTPPLAVPDPALTITTIGVDLGGDMSVHATGEGVPADVLQRVIASIVVR